MSVYQRNRGDLSEIVYEPDPLTHRLLTDGVAFCGERPEEKHMVGIWGDERWPITCHACLGEGARRGVWPKRKRAA